MIDIAELKPLIVERLKSLNPDKIILFGSFAYLIFCLRAVSFWLGEKTRFTNMMYCQKVRCCMAVVIMDTICKKFNIHLNEIKKL